MGGGAALRSAPGGERSHYCDETFAGSPSEGHQAGESHLQRWVPFISEQFRDDPEGIPSWLYQHQNYPSHTREELFSVQADTKASKTEISTPVPVIFIYLLDTVSIFHPQAQ